MEENGGMYKSQNVLARYKVFKKIMRLGKITKRNITLVFKIYNTGNCVDPGELVNIKLK